MMMAKKNHDLHFSIEKEFKEKLKKEAYELNISLAELCRHKLESSPSLTKSKLLLEKLINELNKLQNLGKQSSRFCD
jgi:hypothetical protein